jgi:FkbM family methyltransferase
MGDFRNYEINNLKLYKSLEAKDIKILSKYIGEVNTIIEFGSYDAGDGCYLKSNFPNANVYSIEACPERFSTIKKIENICGIKSFNYAVCDYDGFINFYQVFDENVLDHPKKYGSSGSINKKTNFYKTTFDHVKENTPISVPCITIQTFCKNNKISSVDYMHIDTEGAELKVLSGFGNIRPKILRLENCYGKKYYGEDAYDAPELDIFLSNMNYTELKEGTTGDSGLYIYNA